MASFLLSSQAEARLQQYSQENHERFDSSGTKVPICEPTLRIKKHCIENLQHRCMIETTKLMMTTSNAANNDTNRYNIFLVVSS